MKNFKKIASAIAALSLAACMVAPVATMTSFAATTTEDGLSITVKKADTDDKATHTYEAYQIFSGTVTGTGSDAILTNVKWGDGVNSEGLIKKIKEDATLSKVSAITELSETETDINKVVKALSGLNADQAKALAKVLGANLNSTVSGKWDADSGKITNLYPGYYLVQDASNPTQGAKTSYILSVVDNAEVNVKSAAPTVDKQVADDDNAEDGTSKDNITNKEQGNTWNESADHAIGESFQFKLKAELAEDKDYADYETYKIRFTDTMSKGVAFEKIESLTVDGKTVTLPAEGVTYTADATKNNGKGETSWTLTIDDIKTVAEGVDITNGAVIEVIYSAHLTEDAYVNKKNGATTNENSVKLEYSNNPNASAWNTDTPSDDHGETPEDHVWIFTYEVDSKKYAGDTNLPLGGAKFKLYEGDKNSVGDGTGKEALKFDNDGAGNYVLNKESATENADVITSFDDIGVFNFKGLDAGTYTLVETEAPTGYNLADPIQIVITGNHKEIDDGTNSDVALNITQNSSNLTTDEGSEDPYIKIVDEKGATLPSTGGIGTTLFYLGGGALVAVAGVMLITKKRMTKE